MKTFRLVYTNNLGETYRQTCGMDELFVMLVMMCYHATGPAGKTAYRQAEQMNVGQTITQKIMREDVCYWHLKITRLK